MNSLEEGKVDTSELTFSTTLRFEALVGDFEVVFVIPSKFPPSRTHGHKIPLILGTKPEEIFLETKFIKIHNACA